jgi:hypothetical protein
VVVVQYMQDSGSYSACISSYLLLVHAWGRSRKSRRRPRSYGRSCKWRAARLWVLDDLADELPQTVVLLFKWSTFL